MKPMIKYRGGKSKEIPQLIQHVPDFGGRYIEPFFGGGARGADTYARDFAKIHGIELIEFLPQYDKFPSKVAPLMRNKLIVENCDCLLAFWDGVSRGTKYTLDYANQLHKPIKIVNYKTNEITLINHK